MALEPPEFERDDVVDFERGAVATRLHSVLQLHGVFFRCGHVADRAGAEASGEQIDAAGEPAAVSAPGSSAGRYSGSSLQPLVSVRWASSTVVPRWIDGVPLAGVAFVAVEVVGIAAVVVDGVAVVVPAVTVVVTAVVVVGGAVVAGGGADGVRQPLSDPAVNASRCRSESGRSCRCRRCNVRSRPEAHHGQSPGLRGRLRRGSLPHSTREEPNLGLPAAAPLFPLLVSPVLNSLRWAHVKVNRTTMRMHRLTPGAAHIGSDGWWREVGSQPDSDVHGRVCARASGSAEGRRCGCGPAPPARRGGRGGGRGTHAPSDVQDIHGHDLRLPQSSTKGRARDRRPSTRGLANRVGRTCRTVRPCCCVARSRRKGERCAAFDSSRAPAASGPA